MLQNIVRGERVECVSYQRTFDYRGKDGWGFGFECDEKGNIDESKLHPLGAANLKKCLSGEYDVVDRGVVKFQHHYWRPGYGICPCGRSVSLDGDTRGEGIDCECGRIYNGSGQELAPRSQWEDRVRMVDFLEPKQFNGAPGEVMGDDEMNRPSSTEPIICLVCHRTFRGAGVYQHHREEHHRMAYKNKREWVLRFSCCKRLYCPQCNAEITGTDISAGYCTQCEGKL